jgi:hypothetical protein
MNAVETGLTNRAIADKLVVSARTVQHHLESITTKPIGDGQEMHLWTLDDQGRVVRLRHYVDTAKHIAAFGLDDEHTAALGRRFVLEHNQADYRTSFDELLAPECLLHEFLPGMPPTMDRAAWEQFIAAFRAVLPDIHHSIEDVFVAGAKIAVRWTGHGTHRSSAARRCAIRQECHRQWCMRVPCLGRQNRRGMELLG